MRPEFENAIRAGLQAHSRIRLVPQDFISSQAFAEALAAVAER